MGISDSASRPLAEVRSELDMTLMDLAVVWSPAAERFFRSRGVRRPALYHFGCGAAG